MRNSTGRELLSEMTERIVDMVARIETMQISWSENPDRINAYHGGQADKG